MSSCSSNSTTPCPPSTERWSVRVPLSEPEQSRSWPDAVLLAYAGNSNADDANRAYQAWLKRQQERAARAKQAPMKIQILEVRTDPEYVQAAMQERRRAIFSVDGAKEQQLREKQPSKRPYIDDCADPLATLGSAEEVDTLIERMEATDMTGDE